MTSVGDQTVRPTWKIEIFQGDQREVQEIDLSEDDLKDSQLSNPLKFFNRGQKDENDNAVEAQSTSLIRRQNETEQTRDDGKNQDRDESSDKQ